jgi:hypothetical protein
MGLSFIVYSAWSFNRQAVAIPERVIRTVSHVKMEKLLALFPVMI